MVEKNMQGLSFSFCVHDIERGLVDYEEVTGITTGISAKNEKEMNKVIAKYREIYWYSNPDECERIARQLIADGLIDQPRLRSEPYPPDITHHHWLFNGVPYSNERLYSHGELRKARKA